MTSSATTGPRPRLLFVVNVDWFFLSHRLPLARAAREAGCEVIVAAADTGRGEDIQREGFGFVPLPLSRGGTGPLREVRALLFLVRLYRRLRPHLVHHVTIKPVLYGSLAARFAGEVAVVNAVSGLGYVFTEQSRATLLRELVQGVYRLALSPTRSRTIFQNPDDLALFIQAGLIREDHAVLIRGSGVDCRRFHVRPEPAGEPVVMLASRMLRDKGVPCFLRAARILRERGSQARFVLVGDTDPDNPASCTEEELGRWVEEGVAEWWGHREDMAETLGQAHIVVLPSRREGLPKVLLEAAASGRPLVATDVPGCREVVRNRVNGLLVPLDNAQALAEAMAELIADPFLRVAYGSAARRMVEEELCEEVVVRDTLALYREQLGERWPAGATDPVVA